MYSRTIQIPGLSLPPVVRMAIERIALGYQPRQIWLYGSYARGDFNQGSDLDLVIIKETTKKFPDRIEEVLQYAPRGIAVEPLVYTESEKNAMLRENNSFFKVVFSEGILVYEQKSR